MARAQLRLTRCLLARFDPRRASVHRSPSRFVGCPRRGEFGHVRGIAPTPTDGTGCQPATVDHLLSPANVESVSEDWFPLLDVVRAYNRPKATTPYHSVARRHARRGQVRSPHNRAATPVRLLPRTFDYVLAQTSDMRIDASVRAMQRTLGVSMHRGLTSPKPHDRARVNGIQHRKIVQFTL